MTYHPYVALCFGCNRFSVRKFFDYSEWTQVRNRNGVSHDTQQRASKSRTNWSTLPKDAPLINLAVVPKAKNDHNTLVHEHRAHNKSFITKSGKSD